MKILLIQPPVQDFYDTDIRLQPIGLCYLKAAVKQRLPDVEVVIRDYHTGHGRKTIAVPKELQYLRKFYPLADKGPFSSFYQYYHFGLGFDEIEKDIAAVKPDVVGISSLFTPYFRESMQVADRVKKVLDVPVVMGGSHVSAVPESVLSHQSVDYIVRGEGERSLVEFLMYLQGRLSIDEVSNLGYKLDGKMKLNPQRDNYPIDSLPHPDLSALSLQDYKMNDKPMAFMTTSRSCPHKCTFCSVHATFGKAYRRRGVVNVLREIRRRYAEGFRIIDFEDDNLTYYKEDFKFLCRLLIEEYPQGQLELVAMNGISYLSLDDELLQLMQRAGFSQINLSLVSTDKTVRGTTKRPHTKARYIQVVEKAHSLGMRIVSYQILGLPIESLQSMVQTLAFNARLPVLLGASPFYRIPGSPIAKDVCLDESEFVKARLTALGINQGEVKRSHVYTLFIITRVFNFLKSLELDDNTTLVDLLKASWPDQRTEIGIGVLDKLFQDGRMHFHTKNGYRPNDVFDVRLFQTVLTQTIFIKCLNGKTIQLPGFQKVEPTHAAQDINAA